MNFLKSALKRSPLGPRLLTWRDARLLHTWTPRDEEAARFYAAFVQRGDLCFDIGANRGNRTKVFRHLGASVIAVEPQQLCLAILKAAYCWDQRVKVVAAACGEKRGNATIRIAEADVLSTLSVDWIKDMSASGRFGDTYWTKEQLCEVTTIDALIDAFGLPAFIKIDVEGYELEVLRGLNRAVRYISFEFVPERLQRAKDCVERLLDIGFSEFNISFGESFSMAQARWGTPDEVLAAASTAGTLFGDVYARSV